MVVALVVKTAIAKEPQRVNAWIGQLRQAEVAVGTMGIALDYGGFGFLATWLCHAVRDNEPPRRRQLNGQYGSHSLGRDAG